MALSNYYVSSLYISESSLYTPSGGASNITLHLEHHKYMVTVVEIFFQCSFSKADFLETVIPQIYILQV